MKFKLQEQAYFDAQQMLTEKHHKKKRPVGGYWGMPFFLRDPAAGIDIFNHNTGHDKDNLEPIDPNDFGQTNLDNNDGTDTSFTSTEASAPGDVGGCDGGAGGGE